MSAGLRDAHRSPGIAVLPLLVGLCLMFGLTIWPRALIDAHGRADHLAAILVLWAMSAGLVRGVGFVPAHLVPRYALSATACFVALALGLLCRSPLFN
jgi:predicted membrane protein